MVIFLIVVGYVKEVDYIIVMVMMMLGIGLNGFFELGFLVNFLDIVLVLVSVLLGVINMVVIVLGIISFILLGFIV